MATPHPADYADSNNSSPRTPLSAELLRHMHRTMVRIRVFEDRVLADYLARKIPGFTHLYAGQEAVAAGACAALRPDDYLTSTHRGHGHAIAKGVELNGLMAEIYGKATGICHGRGGSMHVADFRLGMLGANGIVGGGFGIAAGAALSAALRGSQQIALCFFGDGGMNKGQFHEALNFAAVRKLPVIYLCENNHYAQYTDASLTTAVRDLAVRAGAYGMPGFTVDGDNPVAVYEATLVAAQRARTGDGPSLLVMNTYRFYGHSVGDAEAYRSREEVEAHRKLDPIPRFETALKKQGVLNDRDRESVWTEAKSAVDAAADFAATSPDPDPAGALNDLFTPNESALPKRIC